MGNIAGTMACSGVGKMSKGRASKGSASDQKLAFEKSHKMQTPAEYRAMLRKALFNDDGTDKDVTKGLDAFMQMTVGETAVSFQFVTAKKLWKKSPTVAEACF